MKTLTLEPQFRHDYTVWRTMDRAPKSGYPIQHVQLLMDGGEVVKDAHWAQDLSGEEQPPFIGWFIPSGRGYKEVPGEPRAWAPMP